MSKKFHRDVWVGLVLLLFCAAVLVNAVQISGQAAYLPVALTVPHGCLRSFHYIKRASPDKRTDGEYSYPLTVKNSKYAFLFMFLSLSIILDFDILHIGLQPRYLCFYTKVSETEVIQD